MEGGGGGVNAEEGSVKQNLNDVSKAKERRRQSSTF